MQMDLWAVFKDTLAPRVTREKQNATAPKAGLWARAVGDSLTFWNTGD